MTDPTGGPPPAGTPPTGAPPPPPAQPPPMGDTTTVGGAPRYAEWWKRVVATIIDSVLLGIVNGILSPILGIGADPTFDPTTGQLEANGFFARVVLGNIVALVIGIGYYVYFNGGDRGQTVGKMAMKIRVRDETTGGPAGYGKALIRYVVGTVLFIACIIPGIVDMLFPLWDPKKQTLHDKAAGTIVEDIG
jgi:uncharacterized RDD family membrane protein YckC